MEKGVIDMRVFLPLGIVNHEHMSLASVLDGRAGCSLSDLCRFGTWPNDYTLSGENKGGPETQG